MTFELTGNEVHRLGLMDSYGKAIAVSPVLNGIVPGVGVYCALCNADVPDDVDPIAFMVCSCKEWDCLSAAVRKHVAYHADMLIAVQEN